MTPENVVMSYKLCDVINIKIAIFVIQDIYIITGGDCRSVRFFNAKWKFVKQYTYF